MNILFVANSSSVHARRWSGAMVARGHSASMLSLTADPLDGIPVTRLAVPPWSLRFPQRWEGRYHAFVRSVVRRSGADLVHVHYLEPVYRFTRADMLGRPMVVSVWGSDVILDGHPEAADIRAHRSRILEEADAVTATTHFLADQCRQYAHGHVDPIDVIPFGVDVERFAEARRSREPSGRPRIGFVKWLHAKYGPVRLLEAMPAVLSRFPAAELVLAGDGPDEKALRALAGELKVAPAVTWLGRVPYEQIPALHASLDVFVMPSTVPSESFGVAAVEAQAAGVPVVASDLPGIREAVQAGETALLVPPGDSQALSAAICELLADEPRRQRMGQAGQRFVAERFDFARNVDAMEEVYRRVLSGGGRGAGAR